MSSVTDARARRAVSMAIRRHMLTNSMTQEEMAARIGVSQSALSRYISQQSIPRGGVLMRMARECGIPAAALVGDADARQQLTVALTVLHRIGEGDPSMATLALPLSAFPGDAPLADVIGIEVCDGSADQRFPAGTVLACAPWNGPLRQHTIAVVAASRAEVERGPYRVATAGALSPSGAARTWWSLSSVAGQDGPLPTSGGEIWTPAYRPLVAVAAVESPP